MPNKQYVQASSLLWAFVFFIGVQNSVAGDQFSDDWTQMVITPNGILYYNGKTGSGAVEKTDGSGNQAIITYPIDSFSKGWTHIVNTQSGILWYNSKNGSGAFGVLDNTGNHRTIKTYPVGSFSSGWTSIISSPDGIHYYNAQSGARAVGQIDGEGNLTDSALPSQVTDGEALGKAAGSAFKGQPTKPVETMSPPHEVPLATPENAVCRDYSYKAIEQYQATTRNKKCQVNMDGRWNPTYQNHYQWCLTVSESALINEKRERKKHLEKCGMSFNL